VLLLSPGRALRHGFEYYRHGTLSLYAALDTKTGRVHSKTAARHTSLDFVEFLGEVVAQCRPNQEIHIILDNLSAHKTKAVRDLLAHPRVRLHFTPTYSSWLNQVEIWFAKVERDLIARGVFTSVPDLARRLCATSMLTEPPRGPFAGNTPMSVIASVVTIWLRQATSFERILSLRASPSILVPCLRLLSQYGHRQATISGLSMPC
jgi:transposase